MSNPEIDPYAVTSWGGTKGPDTFDFVATSGQRCLLRKLELEDAISNGIINQLDQISSTLLSVASEGSKEDVGRAALQAFADPERFRSFSDVLEKVLKICIVKPLLYPAPEPGEARVEGRAYIDRIELADRIEIFTAVFEGHNGLEKFRGESEGGVGAVEDVEAVPAPAEPVARDSGPLNSGLLS